MEWTGAAGPIAELVRQSRFDEALARLYQAREEHPEDPSIPLTIQHVRDQHSQQLLGRLGPPEGVPARTAQAADGSLGADERYLLGLVDGVRTLDRLLDISTLGRHRTVRSMAWLVERTLVVMAAPRAPTAPPQSGPVPSESSRAEVRRVLVADANTTQAVLTRTLVRLVLGHGVQFSTVSSGPEAVEIARRERPELLIVEFMLPGSDGLETLRRAREHPDLAGTASLLLVQKVEQDYVRGRVLHRTAVLARPLEKAAVAHALGLLALRSLQRAS